VRLRALAAGGLAAVLGGCGVQSLGGGCPDSACSSPSVVFDFSTAYGNQELDMLVVVDDTPAVAGVAATIPARLAAYADVLPTLVPGGQPPLHVAVISGTIPSDGCAPPASRAAGCGVAAPDQFLASKFCGTGPNFSGAVSDAFACLADFGATGCGTFQPLEAVHRVLAGPADGALAGNTPFFTPGAALAVVIVAGQDDASAPDGTLKPAADYVAELTALAPLSLYPIVIGPPGCPIGGAVPPVYTPRLNQLVSAGNGVAQSICDPSFKPSLTALATRSGVLDEEMRPCMKGVRDMDPGQPGLQPSCVTQDDVTEADGTHVPSVLPMCDDTASVLPCLQVVPDPGPLRNGCWVPQIKRPPDDVAACGPQATFDRITCAACLDSSSPGCTPSP